jgi:hypothetical protein
LMLELFLLICRRLLLKTIDLVDREQEVEDQGESY